MNSTAGSPVGARRGRAGTVALWALSILLGALFIAAGLLKFLSPVAPEMFAKWGYPDWFRVVIGSAEVGGGLLLLLPATAWLAAGALLVIMTGAALTHLANDEGVNAVTPLVLLLFVALVGYLRLPDRGQARRADEASGRQPPMRWWIAGGVLAVACAAVTVIQLNAELEDSFKFMWTFMVTLATVVLLAVWFLFLTGLRWRIRLGVLAAVVLLVVAVGVGLANSVRWDGSLNGAGTPHLVWKWTPKADIALPELAVETARSAEEQVDLRTTYAEDYPGFLGRDRLGVVPGVRLARDWTARPPRQLWRQPIGAGWSSFAVVGEYAVTQEQRGDSELVVCYEVRTGRPRWTHSNPVRFSEAMGGDGPRATPTISGGRVYALGATGILDCLDGATGKPVWSRDILKEHNAPNLIWGKSSSPLVVDDLVVVSGGMSAGPMLLAYRKDTGEPAWQAGTDKASYSSPVLATLAKTRQMLSVNAGSVTGHAPADGSVLWEYEWPGDWAKCSQPVALPGDRVFISAGYGLGCAMLQVSRTPDGKQSVANAWSNRSMKTQFCNVVVRDGFAYGLDDTMLECLDLADGKRLWKGGRYGHGQVMLVSDLILVQLEPGPVALAEANPREFRELARFPALSAKTWNNPALAGPYLLVRNDREAACYELPLERTSEAQKTPRESARRKP
jgi:outer membrane protein assembly factor BamB